MRRFMQFFRALKAKLTTEDHAYVKAHLTEKERELFYAMAIFDQRHALNVAYMSEKIAQSQGLNRKLMVRIALLHDVGRTKVSIVGKVFAVLADAIFPRRITKLLERQSRTLYIYYHHAQIGGEILRRLGLTQEAELIEKHHDDIVFFTAPPELKLLKSIDELN